MKNKSGHASHVRTCSLSMRGCKYPQITFYPCVYLYVCGMWLCVYMSNYVCLRMYGCVNVCICIRVSVRMCVFKYLCVRVRMHVYWLVTMFVQLCVYARLNAVYPFVYVCLCEWHALDHKLVNKIKKLKTVCANMCRHYLT